MNEGKIKILAYRLNYKIIQLRHPTQGFDFLKFQAKKKILSTSLSLLKLQV